MTKKQPDLNVLDDAWDQVVGGMDWLKSVCFGEFVDHRPLSAIVADMLVSFAPGIVIVTSARDAVAVVLRLARHPEKREDLTEWVLLSACLIVIALPLAMAAGGLAAAGVGAVVGGIAGSELGAALRAVMLMLIKEAQKLVELVQFLQKFIKGDILKFLRAVKFAPYEKALTQAMSKITGRLLQMVKTLRAHLESLSYFDSVKATIATLAQWEKRFYAVQQDALKHMPKALAELDARLVKVLAQTAPKEVHTVATGVQADKTAAAIPAKQRIRDTPGKLLPKVEEKAPATVPKPKTTTTSKPKTKSKAPPNAPLKDSPDRVKPAEAGANNKKQAVADAAVAADRERITQLSKEAQEAERNGDKALADAKKEAARDILRPHLPEKPSDSWDEVVKRLDVSSPIDGAVFWGGTADRAKATGRPDAAKVFAEKLGGVTLETTPGGRIIDGWDEVNKQKYVWDENYGDPPYARDLWKAVSKKYVNGAEGNAYLVQTPDKLWDDGSLWHNTEKPVAIDKLSTGEINNIGVFTINNKDEFIPLNDNYIDALLRLKGARP